MDWSLFLDDITWCYDDECPHIECERNKANMLNKEGLHSYSMFKGTEACPLYRKEKENEQVD